MRYNIKRLFREHEDYTSDLKALKEKYQQGKNAGLPYDEYSKDTQEINRLRHASSLVRQYIGQEVIERLRTGPTYENPGHKTDIDVGLINL